MEITNKIAVVTGASSGIGRALAVELGLRGARVVIAARSEEKLAETAAIMSGYGIEHLSIPFDITSKPSIKNLIESVGNECGPVDIFVNNAGIGLFENIIDSNKEDMDMVFNTNFWGPLTILQHIVPTMSGGMVVNISSAAAKYAPYQQGMYAASKAALERMTEALSVEQKNIKTLLVIPDRTDTPFMKHVVGPREKATLALQLKFSSAESVAKKIVRAIEKEKRICYPTLKARVYTVLSAVFPGLVRAIITKTIPTA
jgi:short-subunit dehydrogenase